MNTKWKQVSLAAIALALLLTAGCAKGPDVSAPLPPPPTTTGYSGGSCGAVSGTPLYQDNSVIQGTLVGGNSQNTISLNLYTSNYYEYGSFSPQSINGSAQMYFPALQAIWSYLTNSNTQVQQTTFCVSSVSLQGGTPTPGTLTPGVNSGYGGYGYVQTPCYNQASSVSLTLRGLVTLPSPYGGYNSTGGSIQDVVEVKIGPSAQAPAYLCSKRLYGYATVKVSYDAERLYTFQ